MLLENHDDRAYATSTSTYRGKGFCFHCCRCRQWLPGSQRMCPYGPGQSNYALRGCPPRALRHVMRLPSRHHTTAAAPTCCCVCRAWCTVPLHCHTLVKSTSASTPYLHAGDGIGKDHHVGLRAGIAVPRPQWVGCCAAALPPWGCLEQG